VSFPGFHGDLGWVEDAKGLVNAPLAWMAQQVHTHLRIELDEIEMGKRFRNYRPEGATEPTALPTWYKGKVERLAPVTLALMGKKTRTPGRVDISYPNDLTGLKVHIGASLRNLPSRAKMLSQDTQSQFLLSARLTGFARRLHSRIRTALSMEATSYFAHHRHLLALLIMI